MMSESLKRKLEKVKKRDEWPVALLAQTLGCSKKYIYRKVSDGHFKVRKDLGYKKISSESVVRYYENDQM
jgi:hypothetical protein